MNGLSWNLLKGASRYRSHLLSGIIFHVLTAILTVVSIPLVIPFFQIIFDESPSSYKAPTSVYDLEGTLNYGFSRLVAMSDTYIALTFVCITVLVVFLLKNICRYLISYFMVYVRNGIMRDLRLHLWRAYQRMSLSDRKDHQQGHLLSLMTNDLQEVDASVVKIYELLFKTPLIILGSLMFMLLIDVRLTLVAGGLILFTLIIVGGVSQVLKRQSAAVQGKLSTLTMLTDQYLSAMKLIRTYNAEPYFDRRYVAQTEEHFGYTNKMLRRRDLASPLAEFLGVATIVALLYYGTHAVLDDQLRPATFFAFIFAFYNIIDPAKSFAREYANLQRGTAALERVQSFIEGIPDKISSLDHFRKCDSFSDQIELRDVHYSYGVDIPVLDNVNVSIKAGENIGVIGLSGAGKTTLFDLILGHIQPSKGQVSIDEVLLRELDMVSYRELFGWVGQRSELFFGSVVDNITLDRSLDQELLDQVIGLSGLSKEILNKSVGDHTAGLSGGESQRVCLARALYRSPKILLLDEPLSQLDGKHKQEFSKVIRSATENKTVIMITHDPLLLKDVDRILLVKDGKVSDIGAYASTQEGTEEIINMLRSV